MQWSDEGIVLSARRHGEHALVVQILTRGYGRHAGLVRGGQGPKLRTVYQAGNRLTVGWRARLAEHLGVITGELLRGHAAHFMDDPARLSCLVAACGMAEATLPEREPHPRAFDGLRALLDALGDDAGWAVAYVEWELTLLAELGFGIDLTRCAATGETSELIFVSPKSGQAVSAQAGEPYRDRLLRLPGFLLAGGGGGVPQPQDVIDGIALTGYFLDHRVFRPHDRKMPLARSRFVDQLERMATISRGHVP